MEETVEMRSNHQDCEEHLAIAQNVSKSVGKVNLIIFLSGGVLMLLLFQIGLTLEVKYDFMEKAGNLDKRISLLEYMSGRNG